MQYSTVQYTIQHYAMQYITQDNTIQCNATQHNTIHNAIQITIQYNTTHSLDIHKLRQITAERKIRLFSDKTVLALTLPIVHLTFGFLSNLYLYIYL